MNPLRVGLVGYGFGSRVFHVPLLQDLPEFSIAGVYSPSEATRERARHELGVPAYDRLESLLGDDGIDLAVISTPHDSHASLALQALAAGKNVVVDKVMCLTLEEADAMIAAARAAGRILSVYQNRRWDGGFLTLRRLLAEGARGKMKEQKPVFNPAKGTIDTVEVDIAPKDRMKALELAGKTMSLFTDKLDLSGDIEIKVEIDED